ncbi:MAG: FecR domain-containing protein [Bacteroidota bacterium]
MSRIIIKAFDKSFFDMKITPDLLEKYAQGKCAFEEEKAIEHWLQTPDPNDQEVDSSITPFQENKIWKAINADMIAKENQKAPFKRIWAVAASVALLISVGLVFKLFRAEQEVYTAGLGEINRITLSDGTNVTLNSGSELIVLANFESDVREVTFSGEAYFKVAKDATRPFIITTATSRTEVLGTEFNLKSYPQEAVTLTLTEGKVAFSGKGHLSDQYATVLPNEQVVLDNRLRKYRVDASKHSAWMHNEWYFNNEPLIEIIKRLERSFDVRISVNRKELLQSTFKGNYRNPILDLLLEDMGFVMNFNYSLQVKKITIQ